MCESEFYRPIPLKDTTNLPSIHPWEKSIKSYYANKIKHAHNSIQNPVCPKPKSKIEQGRIQFTIIGNVTTKEFIYCAHLAQAMHSYRSKIFKAPAIRGITAIQWPSVWNDLKLKYGGEAYCLLNQVAVLKNGKFFGGDVELKEYLEGHFIYHVCLDYHKEALKIFLNQVKNSGRPFAYLHISIDDKAVGTLIFMLYSDLVPNTCQNFLRLCTTRRGGYSGTPVHRIVKDNWIQCGGLTLKSKYDLGCENFIVPHDRRGVLAMCNDGRDIDCSTQFFVLLQPAMWMSYTYVAFGQLIDGEETLKKIEQVSTFYEAPTSAVMIYKAGILNMDCRDIYINKGAQLFLNKHIEDLVSLGEWLMEILLQRLGVIIKSKVKKSKSVGEIDLPKMPDKSRLDISRMNIIDDFGNPVGKRAKRKKPKKIDTPSVSSSDSSSLTLSIGDDADKNKLSPRSYTSSSSITYVDWDFEPEPEIESYSSEQDLSTKSSEPAKPFYLPLTDIPYPDEKDSCFDLKRMLEGDYCLESDIVPHWPKQANKREAKVIMYTTFLTELVYNEEIDDDDNAYELDSVQEEVMENYLMSNLENMSYAGHIIRKIGKRGVTNYIFENVRTHVPTPPLTPLHFDAEKEAEAAEKAKKKEMRRRPTGYVSRDDLAHMDIDLDDDDEEAKKVRVLSSDADAKHKQICRRPTAFIKKKDLPKDLDDEDEEEEEDEDGDGGGGGGGGGGVNVDDDEEEEEEVEEEQVVDEIVDLADDFVPLESVQTRKMSLAERKEAARRRTEFASELEKVKLIDRVKHLSSSSDEEEQKKEEPPPAPVLFFRPTETEDAADKPATRIKALQNKTFIFGDEELRRLRLSGAIIMTKLTEDEKRKAKWAATLADFKSFQNIQTDAKNSDEDEEEEEDEVVDERGKVQLHISKKDKAEMHRQMKRRPTGFIKPEDLAKLFAIDVEEEKDEEEEDEEEKARKEVIRQMKRRPTGFIRPQDLPIDEDDDDEDDDGQDKDQYRDDEDEEEEEEEESEPEPKRDSKLETESEEEEFDFKEMSKRRQTEFSANLEKIRLIEARKSSSESTSDEEKRVHMDVPDDVKEYQRTMKRRPTGFIKPSDLPILDEDDDDDEDKTSAYDDYQEEEEEEEEEEKEEEKKEEEIEEEVYSSLEELLVEEEKLSKQPSFLPTIDEPTIKDEAVGREEDTFELNTKMRPSVLSRLYKSILDKDEDDDNRAPTLKYSRRIPEEKNLLLTFATRIKDEPDPKEKYRLRPSIDVGSEEFDKVASIQYGKRVSRNISSDYVTRINQLERLAEEKASTLRHTFPKLRPQLTVEEYQQRNRERKKYWEENKRLKDKLLERRFLHSKCPSAAASYTATVKEKFEKKLPHSR